ncbi:MAG: PilZ domain-containing protein [Polyangiaceae bacterium]
MARPGHFRAFERRSIQLTASIRRKDNAPAISARTVNIGLGGVCLELDAATQSPRSEVVVEITAPSLWDPLVLRGEIIWEQPAPTRGKTRVGVRFAHESDAAIFSLFEVLNTHGFE